MSTGFVTDYSLRLAQKHVEEFRQQDDLMAQHHEAMKCRACEEFLAAGMKAFTSLRRADTAARRAAVEGIEVPDEVRDALERLLEWCLATCEHAEQLIQEQHCTGFQVENLKDFQEAREWAKSKAFTMEMNDAQDEAFRGELFDDAFWRAAHDLRST